MAAQCRWVALAGREPVLGGEVTLCTPARDGSRDVAVLGAQVGAPWPHCCREWGDEGGEVLVRRSPCCSLGPSPARELSAGCRLGVPAEVWELCLHPLRQPWVRIPVLVQGDRAGAAGAAGPTGLLPAPTKTLTSAMSAATATLPSCCPSILLSTRQGCSSHLLPGPSWSCCHQDHSGFQPGALPAPDTVSRCSILQT